MTLYQLYDNVPPSGTVNDDLGVSVGTEFLVTAQCWLTQLSWQRATDESTGAIRTACLYQMNGPGDGQGLAVYGPVYLPTPAQGEWGIYDLPTPFELTPGIHYKAAVYHHNGRYTAQAHYFDTGPNATSIVKGPITVLNSPDTMGGIGNGTYNYSNDLQYPFNTFNSTSYFPGATISDVDLTLSNTINFKRSESGVWVSHSGTPKVYIGGSWIDKHPQYWNGTGWTDL